MSKTEPTPANKTRMVTPTKAGPATTLHDVVVTNEQTGAVWRARRAEIIGGRIHVRGSFPDELLANAAQTFVITALDAGNRARRFVGVVVDRDRTRMLQMAVFI
jgi:hypothetical protein